MNIRTYDRLSLAKEQLDTALKLFLDDNNYSSAITLAGAAEEIFGQAISLAGDKNALEQSYELMADVHALIQGVNLDKKYYVEKENLARNALKHLQEDKGETITIDLEDAACWMLVRALQNARKLNYNFDRLFEFENWFGQNIVGS